jgi:hypothetical protein
MHQIVFMTPGEIYLILTFKRSERKRSNAQYFQKKFLKRFRPEPPGMGGWRKCFKIVFRFVCGILLKAWPLFGLAGKRGKKWVLRPLGWARPRRSSHRAPAEFSEAGESTTH